MKKPPQKTNSVRKYQIGVIGLGARGECFARELYTGTDRARLFGLCDVDGGRANKCVHDGRLKDARTFSTLNRFLARHTWIRWPSQHRTSRTTVSASKSIYLARPIVTYSTPPREAHTPNVKRKTCDPHGSTKT